MSEHDSHEQVECGPAAGFPLDRATAIAEGRAVIVRVGDTIRAFENRCLHADQPLAGGVAGDGVVSDGVLMCPHHFWRFDGTTGEIKSSGPTMDRPCLESFNVEVTDDQVIVSLPQAAQPSGSIRDLLLDHARTWVRDAPTAEESHD